MAGNEHPINGMMDTTLEKIRQMVDSNTVIGNPINMADGTTILPVSRVSFGFASGGSDFVASKTPSKDLFGGGSGAGVSIAPVAFLVVKDGNARLLKLAEKEGNLDKFLNMLPDVINKIQSVVSEKKEEKEQSAPSSKSRGKDGSMNIVEEVFIVEEKD